MEQQQDFSNFKLNPLYDPRESESPTLLALYDWWCGLRRGKTYPDWSDVDVTELKPWMGWLNIYGLLPDRSDAKFRLVGTEFAAVTGYDLTGKMLSEGSYSMTPAIVLENLCRIADHEDASLQRNKIYTNRHLSAPSERLWMPFAEPGQPVDRIMIYYQSVDVLVHPADRSGSSSSLDFSAKPPVD